VFCFSKNFLTLEIFFGKLMTEEVIQMVAYDGFTFFCELLRRSFVTCKQHLFLHDIFFYKLSRIIDIMINKKDIMINTHVQFDLLYRHPIERHWTTLCSFEHVSIVCINKRWKKMCFY